jgi:hypothetical protein
MADYSHLDPETLAALEATSGDSTGFFPPQDQMELMRRRAQMLQLQLDANRQGVQLAHSPDNDRLIDMEYPNVNVSTDQHGLDEMRQFQDISPFINSGFSSSKPATLNGWGEGDADRLMRRGGDIGRSPDAGSLAGAQKMQLEEPDDPAEQKRKAALASLKVL